MTSLSQDAATVAELCKRRVQVETIIRNLKVVPDTESIRAKSVDTFDKERSTSIAAYDLAGQFRRQVAEIDEVKPRKMSFKRTWTTFQTFLLRHLHTDTKKWREAFVLALHDAAKGILPHRSAKREAYQKRRQYSQVDRRGKPMSKIAPSNRK